VKSPFVVMNLASNVAGALAVNNAGRSSTRSYGLALAFCPLLLELFGCVCIDDWLAATCPLAAQPNSAATLTPSNAPIMHADLRIVPSSRKLIA
jgi:hypothetical protein